MIQRLFLKLYIPQNVNIFTPTPGSTLLVAARTRGYRYKPSHPQLTSIFRYQVTFKEGVREMRT